MIRPHEGPGQPSKAGSPLKQNKSSRGCGEGGAHFTPAPLTRSWAWWSADSACSRELHLQRSSPRFSLTVTWDGPQFRTQRLGQSSRRYNLSLRIIHSHFYSLSPIVPFFLLFLYYPTCFTLSPSHSPSSPFKYLHNYVSQLFFWFVLSMTINLLFHPLSYLRWPEFKADKRGASPRLPRKIHLPKPTCKLNPYPQLLMTFLDNSLLWRSPFNRLTRTTHTYSSGL